MCGQAIFSEESVPRRQLRLMHSVQYSTFLDMGTKSVHIFVNSRHGSTPRPSSIDLPVKFLIYQELDHIIP